MDFTNLVQEICELIHPTARKPVLAWRQSEMIDLVEGTLLTGACCLCLVHLGLSAPSEAISGAFRGGKST